MTERVVKETPPDVVYLIQCEFQPVAASGEPAGDPCWRDVGVVTVPARTHRSTVLRRALEVLGITPGSDAEPLNLRVLDAASAKVSTVRSVQAPPTVVIS